MKKILAIAAAVFMLAGCIKVNTPLSINPSSVTLNVGDEFSVSISFDGDAEAVTSLQSENPSIASVRGTIITGVSAGQTRVFTQQLDADGKVVDTAYCNVTVLSGRDD